MYSTTGSARGSTRRTNRSIDASGESGDTGSAARARWPNCGGASQRPSASACVSSKCSVLSQPMLPSFTAYSIRTTSGVSPCNSESRQNDGCATPVPRTARLSADIFACPSSRG